VLLSVRVLHDHLHLIGFELDCCALALRLRQTSSGDREPRKCSELGAALRSAQRVASGKCCT
jgi:hypothetical protein